MNTLKRCIDFLDRNRIDYTHTRHANAYRAREVALAERVPAQKLAKTVVFCGDSFYAMAVLPANCRLELEEMGIELGLQRLRLATEAEVSKLFPDCEVGAMPPFGKLFNLPVYLDERLVQEREIIFSAGTHRDAIHMSLIDYLRLEEPLVTCFARPEVFVC